MFGFNYKVTGFLLLPEKLYYRIRNGSALFSEVYKGFTQIHNYESQRAQLSYHHNKHFTSNRWHLKKSEIETHLLNTENTFLISN